MSSPDRCLPEWRGSWVRPRSSASRQRIGSLDERDTASQGEDLRAGKKAAFQHHPGYADLPGSNAGDYAYPSQPIDIHGSSAYTFDFGPLDQNQFFNSPLPGSHVEPSAPNIALFAPPDYPVQLAPTTEPSIVTKDGGRYLRQSIELTGDPRPCTQLVIWLV